MGYRLLRSVNECGSSRYKMMADNILLSIVLITFILLVATLVIWLQNRALRKQIAMLGEFCRSSEVEAKARLEHLQENINLNISHFSESLERQLRFMNDNQHKGMTGLSSQVSSYLKLNEEKLEKVRQTVAQQLHNIQQDNAAKLEKMRHTVEEKLHDTLEKRLGDSFKLVSDRLEIVHKGLGEMQNLASGVGDLKRVLTNVKTRGVWGEVQLENIITQLMTSGQYAKNVKVSPADNGRVEFAIKLPSHDDKLAQIWLPIDAKFPVEDYYKLVESNTQDPLEIEKLSKNLETSIKKQAKLINDKYIQPPYTTNFAIMFLPIEALYAEVLKRPGLIEKLQQDYRVVITSPTTLSAILNSLQMGFKTIAIEQRTSEIWKILGSVKTEFVKFSDLLEKTKTKLDQASKVIGDVQTKSNKIQRELREVESLDGNNDNDDNPLIEEGLN
jgi:DNA recombination protein RmuC